MTDEDRLRERMREQVATAPVLADMDDLAARIQGRGRGLTRPLTMVAVVALLVGTVIGFSAGRVGNSPSRAVAASNAPSSVNPSGGSVAGSADHSTAGGADDGTSQRLFLRATSDGVAIRVYLGPGIQIGAESSSTCPANRANQSCGGDAPQSVTVISAELSTDAAVTTGRAAYSTAPTAPLGEISTGAFGEPEGSPARWVIVRVRSGVARVRVSFGNGGSDEMQPQQGVAVLARLGNAATVIVDALDPRGHVQESRTASTSVPTPAATPPTQELPAPGPTQPADSPAARRAVTQAFAGAFDGSASDQTRSGAIQGGSALVNVFEQLRHGPVAASVAEANTIIEGIVFLSPTRAAVKFHSQLGSSGNSGPYFGDAILTTTGWQVSHASYCQIIIPAGVQCPNP